MTFNGDIFIYVRSVHYGLFVDVNKSYKVYMKFVAITELFATTVNSRIRAKRHIKFFNENIICNLVQYNTTLRILISYTKLLKFII